MTLTFNQLLGVVVSLIGLIALFVLFWHRPPLVDTKEQAKEEQIRVAFESKRKTESERIAALDKEELLAELNRDRK